MTRWMSCDLCDRQTTRLHSFVSCGIEGAACDECYEYDAEAYDEPPAQYLDEQIDPQEEAWEQARADDAA